MRTNLNIQSKRHPSAALPTEILNDASFSGHLKGLYIENTQYYNILPTNEGKTIGVVVQAEPSKMNAFEREIFDLIEKTERAACISDTNKLKRNRVVDHELSAEARRSFLAFRLKGEIPGDGSIYNGLFGIQGAEGMKLYELFIEGGKLSVAWVRVEPYSLKLDLFSRNTGILESDIMLNKKALFIGCGSVGSLVAVELAKAGVGHFMLVDNDIFGYHNICRHQCGIYDVGRYKTDALADRILAINPYAEVKKFNRAIEDVDQDDVLNFCDEDTVIVGGADNREGDLYACNLGLKAGASFVSIGCWERAFAGEIFYCLPEGTPTYSDFLAVTGYVSGRVTQNRRFYTTETDLEKASFEPGISADVNFVTIVGVKLILDLLNRDNTGYTQRVLPYLTQYTLVCNTNDPKIGGEQAEIFSYPLQVTTSIIVPYADESKNNE